MAHNPLNQFLIKPLVPLSLWGYDISFTNSSLVMVSVSALIISSLTWSILRSKSLIPSRMQAAAELTYNFILDTTNKNIGPEGYKFVPLIFSLFSFVLLSNALSMLPYSFTVNSHIIVTFALATLIFISVTVTGFIKHGKHFLTIFLPSGVPSWLAPLMIVIELFTYLARPIILALRLAANMTAGHILLKVIAGFIMSLSLAFKFLPILLVTVLCGFELFISLLQAYIFTILACVYISDAVNLH